jgi:hypothetical protein
VRRFFAGVLVLAQLCGCAGRESQIDGSRVSSIDELQAHNLITIHVFAYKEADERGWPARPEHQRFIRFLQDGGVTVAFRHDDNSGLYYAAIRGSDVIRVANLKQAAKARGVPVPSMVPVAANKSTR